MLASVWLGCSVASLLLSLLSANTFAIAGSACALMGAGTLRFLRCRGGADLAASITRMHTCAAVSAFLCGIVALLSGLVAFGLSAS